MRQIKVQKISQIGTIEPKRIADINIAKRESSALLCSMQNETTDWLEYSEAANNVMNKYYLRTLQNIGASIVSNIVCSGVNSRLTRDDITYSRDVYPTAAPGGKIYKTDKAGTTTQGQFSSPGRMNGITGWSTDRNLIAAALASYTHNFVALMMAFFSRAQLPLNESVQLPNLVLAETREPKQFVPPLSMSYNILPSPVMVTRVKTTAPVASQIKLVQWNSSKEDLAESEVIDIPAGTSTIEFVTQLYPFENSGILNIEPVNAPQGITIESIETIPPAM